MRETDAGAALNVSERWIRSTLLAVFCRSSAQSSAESPAAEDDDVAAGVQRRVPHRVEEVALDVRLDAGQLEPDRGEGADAAGDDDALRDELGAEAGADEQSLVGQPPELLDLLPEVKGGREGADLLEQLVDELLGPDRGVRRDVVDRLGGVELGALTARPIERLDDVSVDVEQTELEDLEQAAGAGSDDDDVGLDAHGVPRRL